MPGLGYLMGLGLCKRVKDWVILWGLGLCKYVRTGLSMGTGIVLVGQGLGYLKLLGLCKWVKGGL